MRSTRQLLTGIGAALALLLSILTFAAIPPAGAQTTECHPDYHTCLDPSPPDGDLNCGDIGHRVYLKNAANDDYNLDSDGDAVGCDASGSPEPSDGSGPGRSATTTTTAAPVTTTTTEPTATTTAPTTTATARPAPTTTAKPAPTTTARPAPTTTAAPRGCHPAYIDCVLMELGDRNCISITNQIRLRDVKVDPYGLDRDNDGIGCERDGSDSANPPTTTTAKPTTTTVRPAPTTTAQPTTTMAPAPPSTTTTAKPAPTTTAPPMATTTAKPTETPTKTARPTTRPATPATAAPTTTAPKPTTTTAPAPAPATPPTTVRPTPGPTPRLPEATSGSTAAAGRASTTSANDARFTNHLSNSREVPAVSTKALGYSVWTYDAAANALSYRIIFRGLTDLIGAHLHMGSATENGPVVAALDIDSEQARNATSTDRRIDGVITEDDLASGDMSDLLLAIQSGDIYVNMHSADIPTGAIRGQLG